MMKTIIQRLKMLLIITIPVFFLSSCEDADLDLLEMVFEAWAEENGLYENGEYKPQNVVEKAVDDYLGQFTNSETSTQFDAIAVVRDIEEADKIANEAMAAMDKDKLEEAIKIRPNDWRLREQMGVLKTSETRVGISTQQFEESNDLIEELVEQGADCVSLQKQQYEYRESLLYDAIKNCDDTFECNDRYLAQELALVQLVLAEINAGIEPVRCIGK
jgi:hypothetical protein